MKYCSVITELHYNHIACIQQQLVIVVKYSQACFLIITSVKMHENLGHCWELNP